MFVELTADLIASIVGAFCERRDIVPKRKDFKKVFNTIVQDDDVEKFYFCEATCVGSGEPCMRQVSDEESYCHFHDPDFRCKGTKLDETPCGAVANKDSDFCWRHQEEDDEEYQQEDEQEITKKSKKHKYKRHSHSDDSSDGEIAHKKSKKNKRHDTNAKKSKKNRRQERDDVEIEEVELSLQQLSLDDDTVEESTASDTDDDGKPLTKNFFPLRDRD